ncbi:MAG TPA: hypothetical protein VGS22_09880 [Thermoanaerobaculia bacterium]|jgi:hypothetical protein|nr:hypothetical protein [Thermoanaerobaculia bacterium]
MHTNVWRPALILALFAAVGLFGSHAVRAADIPLPDAPAISTETPAAPAVSADGSDLFLPKPSNLCWADWCIVDQQCEDWIGPGWYCDKSQGGNCGLCEEIPH